MIIKAIEIRDEGTCIGALAIRFSPENDAQRAIFSREGYGSDAATQAEYIGLLRAHDLTGASDPFKQSSHTMHAAHLWVREHWDEITDGSVVDVEFISGAKPAPKASEIQGVY